MAAAGRGPGATAQHLQRTLGNQATQALLQRLVQPAASHQGVVQAKLTVGAPDDMYEREADAAANRVVAGEPAQEISRLPAGGPPQRQPNGPTARPRALQREQAQEKDDLLPMAAMRPEKEEEREEPVQARAQAGDAGIDTGAAERAMAQSGSGSSLPPALRMQMEEGIGADFSNVRVHTGAAADDAARALNARAFTRGGDIYLARGESQSDPRLMGHELTHVVQQRVDGRRTVQRSPDPPLDQSIAGPYARALSDQELERLIYETRAFLAANPVTSEETDAQRRNLEVLEKEVGLRAIRTSLAASDIAVTEEQVDELYSYFPSGVEAHAETLYVVGAGSGIVASAKTRGFRLQAAGQLRPTVAAYILRPGHGRSIVLTSRTGPTIVLDAGAVTAPGAQAVQQGLQSLIQAGEATAPSQYRISHTDADHMNAIRSCIQQSGVANPVVELTAQQYQNAVGQADYARARIQIQPQLIDVDIQGNVHVRRQIFGSMEITEYRLVSVARAQEDPTRTAGQLRALKNASSPVTIVRDLIEGGVMVFTADAPGRALNEVVDSIGEEAFRRVLGGGTGRYLALGEAPHHGGRVGPGLDATGMIRFLRLQFEASNGQTPFFTQTSTRFSAQPGASIRVLNDPRVGVSVEAITEGPGNEPVRARGGQLEQISINAGQITQVIRIGQQNETTIQSAYARLRKIAQLQERAGPWHSALAEVGQAQELVRSIGEIRKMLGQEDTRIRQLANAFWDALEGAARPSGLRVGAMNFAGVAQAGARLASALPSGAATGTQVADPVRQAEASQEAIERMAGLQGSLLANALAMYEALMDGRVRDLPALKAQQRQLLGEATRILGAREVLEHVRAAWTAEGAAWSPANFNRIASRIGNVAVARRIRMTRYQIQLSETLSLALRSRDIVERASHGAGGARSARTRVGAGFLAALEALRIGLELWETYEEASEGAEIAAQNRLVQGRNMVAWWTQRGVFPEISLLDEDNELVGGNLSQEDRYAIIFGNYQASAPTFARVVVTEVTEQQRAEAVGQLTLAATTLDDWYRLVEDERYRRHRRGWTPFKRQDGRWYTLVWNLEAEEYQASFSQAIHERLEDLHAVLRANQKSVLEFARSGEETYSVEDTAIIFGVDRYVYVYNTSGRLQRIDFEDLRPRFFRIGRSNVQAVDISKIVVKAADGPTYEKLRGYLWPTGGYGIGRYGTTYDFGPNSEGYALVEPDDLERY